MNKLIAELEQATEGSRELEMQIGILLGWKAPHAKYAEWGMWLSPGGESEQLPWFTTSLDAALTLVPEGCGWYMNDVGEGGIFKKETADSFGGCLVVGSCDGNTTPALALCIAALKARQAMEKAA